MHLSTIYRNLDELERLGVDRPFPSRARTGDLPPGRECALPLRLRALRRRRQGTGRVVREPGRARQDAVRLRHRPAPLLDLRSLPQLPIVPALTAGPGGQNDSDPAGERAVRLDSLRFGSMPDADRPHRRGDGRHAAARGADGRRANPSPGSSTPWRPIPTSASSGSASAHRPGEPSPGRLPGVGQAGAAGPDPGRRPSPGVGAHRPPPGGAVDRPGRRGARHQLRRATLTEGGPAGDRARPDPAALPRAVQPDVAAVSRPHSSRRRARAPRSTRSPRPWRTTSWIISMSGPIGCT